MLSIAILFCVGFFASTQGTRDALSKMSIRESEKRKGL